MTEREIAHKKAAARKARKERERKARNRRVLLTVCLMLAVCVGSIGGTIAWLQDETESVVNTFSPSNINIRLEEEGATADKDGNLVNDNFKMVPGTTESKKPHVVIEPNSEKSWVFIKVTEEIKSGLTFSNYIDYEIDTNNWKKLSDVTGLAEFTDIYYSMCEATGAESRTSKILTDEQVSYPSTITKEMMDALGTNSADYPKLTFKAAAIQYQNMENVADAWNNVKSELGYGTTTGGDDAGN